MENILNGDCYIGSSLNLSRRKSMQFCTLRKNYNYHPPLQNAFNEFGEENFVFKVILYCEPEELNYYEQNLVDLWKPAYNTCVVDVKSKLGTKMKPETLEKIKKNHPDFSGENNPNYGVPCSDEKKEKLSIAQKGEKSAWWGRKHTEEELRKMSLNHAKTREKASEETKKKMSESAKNRWAKRKSEQQNNQDEDIDDE